VRATPPAGDWTLAQVVDHIAQSTIRGAEELRHLVAGRRPPGPPVYEALLSGAAAWAAWDELLAGLREANGAFDAVLAEAEVGPVPVGPTARVILVVNRAVAGERPEPETFAAELGWKEYALVQRLHLLDHRSQVRQLRAALGASTS
jgi:hypothetical protein